MQSHRQFRLEGILFICAFLNMLATPVLAFTRISPVIFFLPIILWLAAWITIKILRLETLITFDRRPKNPRGKP